MKKWLFLMAVTMMMTGCLRTPWDYEQAGIHTNLGTAYLEAGQYHAALKELLEANKYTPNDARIHYYLGLAYNGKGLSDKALDELQQAIDIKPDYSEAHNFIGIIYSSTSQWDKAIEAFGKAVANVSYETPAVALYNMGWAYYQKGDYPTAMSKYYAAIGREPNTVLLPVIEKNMGLASMGQGQTDEAAQHFNKALSLVPNYPEALYWLAECHVKNKNVEAAITQFQSMVKAAPDSEFGVKAQKRLHDLSRSK